MLFYSMWLFFGCFSLEETEIMGLYHKIVTLDYSFKFKLHENNATAAFAAPFKIIYFRVGIYVMKRDRMSDRSDIPL